MKISLLTDDKYLRAQAELLLSREASLSFLPDPKADITLLDVDTKEEKRGMGGRVIRLSRHAGVGDETLPLPFDFYRSLKRSDLARLTLGEGGRTCFVDGRSVKLTSHEYALLALLVSKKGAFAKREEISEVIFGGGGDNMINLYIHYLREKLESGAEKIILSSRKQGYAINENFLGGKIC